jgi:hypothetical protein
VTKEQARLHLRDQQRQLGTLSERQIAGPATGGTRQLNNATALVSVEPQNVLASQQSELGRRDQLDDRDVAQDWNLLGCTAGGSRYELIGHRLECTKRPGHSAGAEDQPDDGRCEGVTSRPRSPVIIRPVPNETTNRRSIDDQQA